MPGVGAGTAYKFAVLGADGLWREKADPMACHTEVPPATASVVFESTYAWGDDALDDRAAPRPTPHAEPMSVYEVHLGSWRQRTGPTASWPTSWSPTSRDLGFTHVELMPVMEHPFGGSWGYQVTSYYAPTARFGDPDDFRHLVDRLHQAGIGVILDWVPGALPQGRVGAGPLRRHRRSTRTPTRSAASSRTGAPTSSTSAAREVRNFLVANALYWLEEFHVDGLRVDARRLDALPRLLPRGRASGRRTSTAAGRTSRRCSSSRR